jgi:hypothetical protein
LLLCIRGPGINLKRRIDEGNNEDRRTIEEGFEGDAWHGPSLTEILDGVTAIEASRHPFPRTHSIWEIVLHLSTWHRVVQERLEGKVIIDLTVDQDWPPVTDSTDPAWKSALEELHVGQRILRNKILNLDDARLQDTVAGMDYSVYVMLHGVIQHDLYHAGQIALLKKSR